MALRLRFFAACADWIGEREMDLALERPAVLRDLIDKTPRLAPVLKNQASLRVAINREYADFNCEVRDGDEIAFLPPVSGG